MLEVAVIQVVHPNLSTNYMSEKQVIKWKVKRCPSGPPPLPLIWVLISPGVQGPQGLCSEVYKVSRKKTKNKTKKTHPWCQLTNKISVIQPVISALTDFLVYEAVEQEIMLNMTGRPSNSPALITHAWFFFTAFQLSNICLKIEKQAIETSRETIWPEQRRKTDLFCKSSILAPFWGFLSVWWDKSSMHNWASSKIWKRHSAARLATTVDTKRVYQVGKNLSLILYLHLHKVFIWIFVPFRNQNDLLL